MKPLIVIQARCSSSRLPGKVLLPVAGYPIAVLVAKRAATKGFPVVVATSTDSSDDILASTLRDYGLQVVRGPLEDVLGRCLMAIQNVSDDTAIVRLTADNLFPDGAFVEELVN